MKNPDPKKTTFLHNREEAKQTGAVLKPGILKKPAGPVTVETAGRIARKIFKAVRKDPNSTPADFVDAYSAVTWAMDMRKAIEAGNAAGAAVAAYKSAACVGVYFTRQHSGAAAHGYKIAAADKSVFPKALRQKHARRFSARLAKWELAKLSKRECGVLLNAAIKDDKPLARDCAALPGSGRIFPDAKTVRNWILALRSGNL